MSVNDIQFDQECVYGTNDDRQGLVFTDFLGSRGYTKNALPKPKLELNKINNETYVNFVVESKNFDEVLKELRKKNLNTSNKW